MRRDDDDEMPGDGRRSGGEPSWIDAVVVPDDISGLDADVRALRRERRAAARRRRLRPLRRAVAPLTVLVLVIAAGIAGLVLALPRRQSQTPAAPLASSGADVGRVRGLVPDVRVELADRSTRPVRDFRPAVLALPPTGCACDPALRESAVAAARHGVRFVLVERAAPRARVAERDPVAILRVTDAGGTLARTYGSGSGQAPVAGTAAGSPAGTAAGSPSGSPAGSVAGSPVLVLVAGDGRVSRVLSGAADRRTLDAELALLTVTAPTR